MKNIFLKTLITALFIHILLQKQKIIRFKKVEPL